MADQSGLQTLLSSKAALDLGLITQEDFDQVKSSFLRAQQIKAAVDVGLIKDQDYDAAKNEYLSSLTSLSIASSTPSAPLPAPATRPVAQSTKAPTAAPPPPAPMVQPTQPSQPRPAAPPPAPAPAPRPAPPPVAPTPPSAPPSIASSAPPSRPSSAASLQSNLDVPTNIPKMGGVKAISSGTSMSGIACSEDAVNLFYLIKAKAAYQWATWQIDDSGSTVVISAVGAKGSRYEDFLGALPENDCRYGIYDYKFTGPDGQIHHKLVFFNWAPDSARVKAKMMYASTKDFFKTHLDGISAEFQASDVDEIEEKEVAETCLALKR